MVAQPLRVVFCGTPQFAVPTLAALAAAGHAVPLVLTQPDRPNGRGMQLLAPPVKQWARAHGIAVEQPAKIRDNEALRTQLEQIAPDAIVVVAYGRILPTWMLSLPRLGCINLHGSLLPKYRGAAPIQWAVAHGEAVTGVTTMLLEEGLDTGPTLERRELAIRGEDTAPVLFERLADLGAPLVVSTLAGLDAGTLLPQAQDGARATYAPLLTREDGRLDFSHTAEVLWNRWRGFTPWPGAWSTWSGKKLALQRVALAGGKDSSSHEPGTLSVESGQVYVACGESTMLRLLEIQLEGRRSMPAAEFLRGYPQLVGVRLGR